MQNPLNYSTETGLISALKRASKKPMDVSMAMWLSNVRWVLTSKFNWTEKNACEFVAMWSPRSSAYAANA